MSVFTYTGTGAQEAVILDNDHTTSFGVTSDAGTPVYTVEVQLTEGGSWFVEADANVLDEAFRLQPPVYAMRLNISSLGGASEVYLDVNSREV